MSAVSLNPREKGQGLVEYALILVLVSITVIVILSFLGDSVGRVFQTVDAALNGQAITGTGTEYIVGSFSASTSGGPAICTVTVASVSVTRFENGEPAAAGQSVSISASATGGGAVSGSGTTNSNGVATIGPLTMSGNCAGTVTITAGSSSRSSGY